MPQSIVVDKTVEAGYLPGGGYAQRARNISGSSVAEGAVVQLSVLGTNADILYSFDTTTTADATRVMGIVLDGPVEAGRIGKILVSGFADKVLVNGTTDIAKGDLLGTYTTAGIAAKATDLFQAFGIALEAYATDDSAGEIKALILGDLALRYALNQAGITIGASSTLTLSNPLILPSKTDSNRGGAGTAGRVIFNTDDGQLNIDDGTNWTLPDGTTT